jgi:hypothetical protein
MPRRVHEYIEYSTLEATVTHVLNMVLHQVTSAHIPLHHHTG